MNELAPLPSPHGGRREQSEALPLCREFRCQCWLQAGEVLGAGLSHWKLTAAAGDIIVGCPPVGKGQKFSVQGRAGMQTIKELRF